MKIKIILGLWFTFFFTTYYFASFRTYTTDKWIMGCDNQDRCTAIGYYEQGDNDDTTSSFVHEATWYIIAKWYKTDDEYVSIQLYMPDILPTNISVTLLNGSEMINIYKLIDSKIQKEEEYYYFEVKKDIFLTKEKLMLSYSYANKENNGIISRKENLDLISFIDFVQNSTSQTNKKQLNSVRAFPWLNKTYVEGPLLKIWMDKYGKPVNGDCYYGEQSSLLDTNFIVEIEKFGSLVVLCNETGYNGSSTLWKRDGDDLMPIKISSEVLEQDDDIIYQNMVVGFSLDEADQHFFRATFRGRRLGDCGAQYTFVFNGQQFEIVGLTEMPECANIYNWITLYEQPITRQ